MRKHGRCVAIVTLLVLWCAAGAARAASFSFSPDTVELTAKVHSGVVTIQNPGDKPIHFETHAFQWDQKTDGQMALKPTDDLLVYPPLLDLGPGQKRLLRVTALVPPGDREKTYRVQVTEIPAFTGVNNTQGAQVVLRSQLELPVFLAPQGGGKAAPAFAGPAVRDGVLTFSMVNTGSVRVRSGKVTVTGFGSGQRSMFSTSLDGWYVLAGGHRDYSVPLPAAKCAELRALRIEAEAGAHLSQTIEVAPGACRG